MAVALAKENSNFIQRMLRAGRFNNQSEVVREALRRMEAEETSYLTPPPLTPAQVERIYGKHSKDEKRENSFGRAAFDAVRRAARRGKRA
jgi:Arc/MetJ-type ribon-helix-helix transcriptional regulator